MSGGPADPLVRIYRLLSRIHAEQELSGKMQAVVDAVVDAVGFGMAALNVVLPNGDFEVVAVAGNEEARRALLGTVIPASAFDAEFEAALEWGLLRFIPHDRAPDGYPGSWTPDQPVGAAPDAWHAEDALLAPLRDPAGELIGVLSVDGPRDGLRPSPAQRGLLEVLATEVATAVHNGMLAEQLRISEEIFRQAFDGSGTGMALTTVEHGDGGRFTRTNPALSAVLGYRDGELLALTDQELTHPDDLPLDRAGSAELLAGAIASFRRDKRLRRRDGQYAWVTVTSTVIRNRDGSPRNGVSQVEDISATRSEWESLHFRANHDGLTALPHRPAVMARLEESIDRARRRGRPGAVMFLDLDNFKQVNDSHGHAIGDLVLTTAAERIRGTVREQDLVGRLSGDEFVVIADDVTPDQARSLARRVREAIAAPITVAAGAMVVTVSVGIRAIDVDCIDAQSILRDADLAMYRDKGRPVGAPTDG